MLWLRRKVGDSISIPSLDIEIVVMEIGGDTVRIGVDAPANVRIYRREVWRAMQRDEANDALEAGSVDSTLGKDATHGA
jgi:carbon storage regulator